MSQLINPAFEVITKVCTRCRGIPKRIGIRKNNLTTNVTPYFVNKFKYY